jgi:hypothetical protein
VVVEALSFLNKDCGVAVLELCSVSNNLELDKKAASLCLWEFSAEISIEQIAWMMIEHKLKDHAAS